MIIKAKQLPELAFGYEDCLLNKDEIFLLRFPKNFHDFIDDFQTFASTSAGIHLSFLTDAHSLRLRFCATNINDPALPCAFDVYQNDVFMHHILFEPLLEQEQEIVLEMKGQGVTDIWLPIHVCMKLISLECIEGTFCKRAKKYGERVLFIGDSITQGFQCEYPSLTISSLLSRHWNAEILNQGIGGYSFRKNFVHKLHFKPDSIFVALGTNDISYQEPQKRDPEGFFEKLFTYYSDIPITVITPYKRFLTYDVKKMADMKKRIALCCEKKNNVRLIDGETVSPHVDSFYSDGLHPNKMGMQFIAEELIRKK